MSDEPSVLDVAILIARRCRREGFDARLCGAAAADCPYNEELEKSAWLDGWSKAAARL